MGERKVLNRYFPPDFDPALIPRRKRAKNNEMKIRMMLPFSLRYRIAPTPRRPRVRRDDSVRRQLIVPPSVSGVTPAVNTCTAERSSTPGRRTSRRKLTWYRPLHRPPHRICTTAKTTLSVASLSAVGTQIHDVTNVSPLVLQGIMVFRFYIRCIRCNAEFTFKTDPKNSDYTAEHNCCRNFEPWRAKEATENALNNEKDEARRCFCSSSVLLFLICTMLPLHQN